MKLGAMKEPWIRRGTARRIAPLSMQEIRSIAIIKHAALGDLVHTRPMILALRHYFPNAAITFSAIDHYTNGIPTDLVDRVHVSRGKAQPGTPIEIYQSMRALGRHDIIFDITQSARSHWLCLLNPAHLKIGYKHKGIERLVYDVAIARAEFRFEAETFLEQLNVLGLPFDRELDYGYQAGAAPLDTPYIVYFPTASKAEKSWPAEHYAALLARCGKDFPAYRHVLLTGLADWEKAVCDRILNMLPPESNILKFEGGAATEALVSHASCLISNDTGIRNLAIAHNTPTVGIFIPELIMGYVPGFGKHAVSYSLEGKPPEVDAVYAKLAALLHDLDHSSSLSG